MGKKNIVDWEKIETLYRVGVMSLREISKECGVSHVAIQKRAKKNEWPRDLKEAIMIKAEDIVNRETVKVNRGTKTECVVNAKEVGNAVAAGIAEIILRERRSVTLGRSVVDGLISEAVAMNRESDALIVLGEVMKDPDVNLDKLNDAYQKAISFPGRVDSGKKLIDALAKLTELEREVYGIQQGEGAEQKRHDKITIRLVSPDPRGDDE